MEIFAAGALEVILTGRQEVPPALMIFALGFMLLGAASFALSLGALLHPPLRDRLWPREKMPEAIPLGAALFSLLLLLVGIVGLRSMRGQLVSVAGDWKLPVVALTTQLLVIACALGGALSLRRGPGETVECLGLARPRARHFVSGAAGWLCSLWIVVAASLLTVAVYWLVSGKKLPVQGAVKLVQQAGLGPRLATAGIAMVLAPLFEETFFRGVVFRALRPRMGFWGAGLISATLFAAVHLDPLHAPRLAVLGLILAYAYERTGSLWPAIVLHAVQNSLAMVMIIAKVLPS